MNSKFQIRHIASLVQKARQTCEHLDTTKGMDRNQYWIPIPSVLEDDGNVKHGSGIKFDAIGVDKEEYRREAFDEGEEGPWQKDDEYGGPSNQNKSQFVQNSDDFDTLEVREAIQVHGKTLVCPFCLVFGLRRLEP